MRSGGLSCLEASDGLSYGIKAISKPNRSFSQDQAKENEKKVIYNFMICKHEGPFHGKNFIFIFMYLF